MVPIPCRVTCSLALYEVERAPAEVAAARNRLPPTRLLPSREELGNGAGEARASKSYDGTSRTAGRFGLSLLASPSHCI